LRILAIENILTQNTIAQPLRKMGYEVATSENVQDILSANSKNFDLIFIDIRLLDKFLKSQRETFYLFIENKKRPFILALGRLGKYEDYQQYAELALDDYLALPIPEKHLKNILCHWRFRHQIKETGLPLTQFNTAELLTRVGYSIETLQELSSLFAEDGKRLLGRVYDAIREQNSHQLKKLTHELKGICATLCAKKVKKLTEDLEKKVQAQAFQSAFSLFEQLEQECGNIQQTLKQLQHYLVESQSF
jgi:HPt (histidine-containing phosphotransfer) domain-containing protein